MSDVSFPQGGAQTLRDLISLRELTATLSSFAHFMDSPVWVTDIEGNVYASSKEASEERLQKVFQFAPPPEILSGEARITTAIVEDTPILISGLNMPEGLAGLLAAASPEESDVKKLEVLRDLIEALLRAGWKSAMTSEMHTAAMNVSYRELEEQNRKLNDMLKKIRTIDEIKANFMQTVSHELKTPLTSIIGYAELLSEGIAGDINEEQKDYLKTILEKGQSLLGMITNVLDITRLGAGRDDLKLNMHTIDDIVSEAADAIATQIQSKEIEIVYESDSSLRPVMVDSVRLMRAISAILSNAVKFSPQGSKITIKAMIQMGERVQPSQTPFELPEEELLIISIEDNGIGIPEEEFPKIFNSFYQVDNSSTREYGGTGLGLTLTKNFIEAHGGKIEVSSVINRGSRFTILIPTEMQE